MILPAADDEVVLVDPTKMRVIAVIGPKPAPAGSRSNTFEHPEYVLRVLFRANASTCSQPGAPAIHSVWRVSRANAGARRGGHWIAKRFYQLRRRFCIPRPVSELAHVSAIMLCAQPRRSLTLIGCQYVGSSPLSLVVQ